MESLSGSGQGEEHELVVVKEEEEQEQKHEIKHEDDLIVNNITGRMIPGGQEGKEEEENDDDDEDLKIAFDSPDTLPPLDSLKCKLCKQYFSSPLTLSCLHSFCTSCILKYNNAEPEDLPKYLKSNEPPKKVRNEKGEMVVVEPPKPLVLRCPTCEIDLGLEPPEEIYAEPYENARLERIVSLVQGTPIVCQNCKEAESEIKCVVCDAYCCRPCWKTTHSAPIFQSHDAKPLTHSQLSALPKCPLHANNDLEFFVTEEEVGACQVCLLKGDFVGRPYAMVNDVRAERQAEIESGLAELLQHRARLTSSKKECIQVLQELDTNLETQKNAVKANFEMIRKALAEREVKTLDSLQRLKDAKKEVLDDQVNAIDSTVKMINDGVSNVKLILGHSNPLEVVYSVYVLQDAISTLSNIQPTAPKICSECKSDKLPCHHPAVDSQLPVVLSERVAEVVQAYAAVPDASVVPRIAAGKGQPNDLLPVANPEQKKLLQSVVQTASTNEEELGCVVQ